MSERGVYKQAKVETQPTLGVRNVGSVPSKLKRRIPMEWWSDHSQGRETMGPVPLPSLDPHLASKTPCSLQLLTSWYILLYVLGGCLHKLLPPSPGLLCALGGSSCSWRGALAPPPVTVGRGPLRPSAHPCRAIALGVRCDPEVAEPGCCSHSSSRPEAPAGCPLLLSIYQVKVIALETWGLLTLRDKCCLVYESAEKASCVSGQNL